jgi:uncharacterized protein YndB with AHSA1/START domain
MWKKVLAVIVIVSLVAAGGLVMAAMFAPVQYTVARETTINKTPEEVYAYAKLLKNQNEWGPWFKKEPTMNQEFRGTDGQPGFTVVWKGQNPETGEGEQEIKKLEEGKRIETELRFKAPFAATANSYITTEPAGPGQTKVKWEMQGSMPRPMNIMLLVMNMDEAVGKDFSEGLASMKQVLESKQQ